MHAAFVSNVTVSYINKSAVNVTWSPINVIWSPITEDQLPTIGGYIVYYSPISLDKSSSEVLCISNATFRNSTTSFGVIPGLDDTQDGYQFQVVAQTSDEGANSSSRETLSTVHTLLNNNMYTPTTRNACSEYI